MFGSKSAEREAKNAQAAQYYNELKRISQAPRLTAIDDPEIKGADKYNQEVQKYNTRLDEFATQLKGKSISEKISPIKQEYMGRIAGALSQADTFNKKYGAANISSYTSPMSGMNMGSVYNSPTQKPAPVNYAEQARKLIDNPYTGYASTGNISDMVPNYQAQKLAIEYTSKVDKYKGVAPHRDSMTRLQAMYKDYEKLSASVTQVDKTLGISSQMKQKQARLNFEASASGKVLAGQRRAAGKVGKASTILTKGI